MMVQHAVAEILLFIVICFGVCSVQSATVQAEDLTSCTKVEDVTETLIAGWPHMYSCKQLATQFITSVINDRNKRRQRNMYNGMTGSCLLLDVKTGLTIWSNSMPGRYWHRHQYDDVQFYTPDITSNDATEYRLIFRMPAAKYCSYQDIQRMIKQHPEEKCVDFANNGPVLDTRISLGSSLKLTCSGEGERKTHFSDDHTRIATYTFLHNCNKSLPKNVQLKDSEATITDINFDNGGVYTCAVTYKGHTRYMMNYRTCIESPSSDSFTVTCPEVVKASVGDDVNITCIVDLGFGIPNVAFSASLWYKLTDDGTNNSTYCASVAFEQMFPSQVESSKASCTMKRQFKKGHASCFTEKPSADQLSPSRIQVSLLLKNVEQSDFRNYQLKYWKTISSLSPFLTTSPVIKNITLEHDQGRSLTDSA